MVIGIALISTYVVLQNFGYAALQVWLFRRRQPCPKWMEVAVFLWAFLMSGLFLLQAFEPLTWKSFLREQFYLPMAVEMIWNVLFLQVLFPGMILVVLVVRLWNPVSYTHLFPIPGALRWAAKLSAKFKLKNLG